MTTRRHTGWLLGCMLMACGAPEFPSEATIYTGKYLQYANTTGLPVCQGTFHVQERFIETLAAMTGTTITVDGGQRIGLRGS